jgi:hypothetical protein
LAIIFLPVLLAFYIIKFKEFNLYLVRLNPGHVLPLSVWVAITKFLSYCLHIAINFCILLAITNRLRYSLWFVYISFAILFAGAFLVYLSDTFNLHLSLQVVALFVKINKSLILLVLFIAGHIVKRTHEGGLNDR